MATMSPLVASNNSSSSYFENGLRLDLEKDDNDVTIWDIPSIRITFIVIYTIVFCLCFLGNLTVILVVTLHWRMRSITNFCLANLAVADLCVAIFCIYQNLYSHMTSTWILGTTVCKIYHFINEMSLTASVLILVVISVERYLAIIHPMRCKSWLTLNRLRLAILTVWTVSGIYSLPRLYYTTVISHSYIMENGEEERICTPNRQLYNSKLFDGIHMGLLFFFPLLIISILYYIIGVALWKSSRGQIPVAVPSESSSSSGIMDDETGGNGSGSLVRRHSSHRRRRQSHSCQDILCCLKINGRKSSRKDSSTTRKKSKTTEPPTITLQLNEFSAASSNIRSENEQNELRTIPINQPIVVVKFEAGRPNSLHCHGGQRKSSTKNGRDLNNPHPSPLSMIKEKKHRDKNTGKSIWRKSRDESRDNLRSRCGSTPSSGGGVNFNETSGRSLPLTSMSLRTSSLDSSSQQDKSTVMDDDGHCPKTTPTPKLRRLKVIRATNYGTKALEARRNIIKMLIVIVLTFALCNLPFHGRKIWQNWSSSYDATSTFSLIFTQITTIIRYGNSAINPLLYAFMSVKFRQSLVDLLGCRLRRSFRTTRNFSVRSTNVIPINSTS